MLEEKMSEAADKLLSDAPLYEKNEALFYLIAHLLALLEPAKTLDQNE